MKCILLADGDRIDAGDIIGNGMDSFVIRCGNHVLKIPQLLWRLLPNGQIEPSSSNELYLDHPETEKKIFKC
jgi:hypothetical protein